MTVSNMIKQRLILQEKKDRHNSPGLYCYYNELSHIAIDYRNLTVLAIKKQVLDAFTGNSIALVFYKLLFIKDKKTFLS